MTQLTKLCNIYSLMVNKKLITKIINKLKKPEYKHLTLLLRESNTCVYYTI